MKLLKAESAKYEIERKIGEGLTSEVYKAFRVDSRGETRQVVALKVLKSKKLVHILRQEFSRLIKVQSLHCVKLLGWENLEAGPALVLEHLEGLTLYEVVHRGALTGESIKEILAQVQEGLKSLHQSHLVHGDLNPRNIFITQQGFVKLLDFGWSSRAGETMATPQFMAPELWEGLEKSEATDQFALGLIYKDLRQGRLLIEREHEGWKNRAYRVAGDNDLLARKPEQRSWLPGKSHRHRREKLSKLVKTHLQKKVPETCLLHLNKSQAPSSWKKRMLAACLLLFSFYPQLEAGDTEGNEIRISSEQWLEISVNGLPHRFSPLVLRGLRPGQYKIHWKAKDKRGSKTLDVGEDSLFLLQLQDILLE